MLSFLGIGEKPVTLTSNTVQNIASNVVALSANTISSCTVEASQSQTVNRTNVTIGDNNTANINQEMYMAVTQECEQEGSVDLDMQQDVINSIIQEAKSKGMDISITDVKAVNTTKNITDFEADISMDSIMTTMAIQQQKQKVNTDNVTIGDNNVSNINQEMSLELFQDVLLKAVKSSEFVQNAANDIDQKGEAETQSTIIGALDSIGDTIKSVVDTIGGVVGGGIDALAHTSMVMMIMIAAVIIAAITGFVYLFSGDSAAISEAAANKFGGYSCYMDY
jgi:hypothetical protein